MTKKMDCSGRTVLKMTDTNIYILPHSLLVPYISNYTFSCPVVSEEESILTLIPDASGCFVFTRSESRTEGLCWGAATHASVVNNTEKESVLRVFVEFHPGGLFFFTGIDQWELTDRRINAMEADRALEREIAEAIVRNVTPGAIASALDRIFIKRMLSQKREGKIAVESLLPMTGRITAGELAAAYHYSERHLNRLFSKEIGISTKLFMRLLRLNKAVRLLQGAEMTLTQTAHDAGYFDQAHFIVDFKEICNVSPGNYLKNMSVFYNETLKL